MSEFEERSVWFRPCQPLHGDMGGFSVAFTLAFRLSGSSRDASEEASCQEVVEEMLERARGSLREGGKVGRVDLSGGEKALDS